MTKIYSYLLALTVTLTTSCIEQTSTPPPTPDGFVRVNATIQEYSEVQPWDRKEPVQRRGLGALLPNNQILTTSEMAANHVYLELESADGSDKIPARVVAIDREANLALLEAEIAAPETPSADEEQTENVEPTTEAASTFLDELKPIDLAPALKIGANVATWQLENNGQPTVTKTNIYAVDVVSTHNGGKRFFSYLLKGSLQSASNSYTVPVISGGKLAGLLTSYDSEEQISEVVSSTIIEQFLDDAVDGDYQGFPSLGIAGNRMPDQAFRKWVGLEAEEGGLYITRVAADSAASEAELEVGDVLLALDGHDLDRKGYYNNATYGKLSWTHLIRGTKGVGETIKLKIKRDGELIEKEATLRASSPKLVPSEFDPAGPQYLLKGGVIFQQLTKKYLQAYGNEWTSRAPLNLLDIYYQSEDYDDQFDEAVIITGVIPSQNTVGYESIRNSLVEQINGVEIKGLADLEKGFAEPKDGIHELILSEAPYKIYLDANNCDQVDQALLGQGLPSLKRIHSEE